MTNPVDQVVGSFLEEASERLSELEEALLELENDPQNTELIARAFRALHTIKGSGAMFGFDRMAAFTHEVETAFDAVRSGKLEISKPLIAMALSAKDLIRRLLAGEEEQTRVECERLITGLRALLGPVPLACRLAANAEQPARPRSVSTAKTYRIMFRPQPELFRIGTNPMGLFRELSELGECHVVAHTRQIPALEQMDPETCYVSWDIVLTTSKALDAIRDVFIFVDERASLRIDVVDDPEHHDAPVDYKRIGEILVERGDITTEQLQEVLRSQKRVGDLLVEKQVVAPEAIEIAALEQKTVRELRARRAAPSVDASASSVRVGVEKLDQLVDLVGELVIAQSRLCQLAATRDDSELLTIAETMDRLAVDLRQSTLGMRMVPIGTTFGKFKRLVHDLSGELGKSIELVTEGEETELDKTVIERLSDPLIHLIRNSCDHGIERPELRRERGKPPTGTVSLIAYHRGANVFLEIRDDGEGLHPERILAKAVELGLVSADAKLSEGELNKLMFAPGLSTAKSVSGVSGRGVGMDVVKRSIDALRGSIDVTSTPAVGTTIRLRLPLTLAIIEGLLVTVSDTSYVLPMAQVEECVELTRADVERSNGNSVAAVRGELVPYLRLRDWFGAAGERPDIEQIVIVAADGFRFGFAVDTVVGQHQTVLKSLGRMYRNVAGLSGATILGDGAVALIVDVPALIAEADSIRDIAC